jgi:2,4-dienoyl-CoA reductase-like NADH-dependent reductase (Old Yellow Enzyme family)
VNEPAAYPHLFSPFDLAGRRLRNRIVHLSITTSLSQGRRVNERHTQYYVNRARGGAAMIITEPVNMAPHQRTAAKVDAGTDEHLDELKRWADAVEREDCRLIAQVQDAGRGRHAPGRNPDAVGASALPDDLSWTVPHVLSITEIEAMIEGFARSSARLKGCGFSGIEISAGHGHLFHQFMSPWSNHREDRYGGDFEGRMRLVAELIGSIRSECGKDFILGVKTPGDDGVPGGIDPALGAAVARRITETGQADYLCFAQGSHHRTLEMHTPDRRTPPLTYLGLMRQLRQSVPGIPVMALGRITDPAEAEGILARGDAELVGLGRALITDPAWPAKAAQGRARDIRYCVSGNTCWQTVISHHFIACENNPRVAAPDELKAPAPATRRKRIVIVGAGIAGLEAAWVAGARGHEVIVFGRSREVGGKLRLQAALPNGEQLTSIYDFQLVEAEKAGVRLELGVDADASDVLSLSPDEVIMASGARMTWPLCLPRSLMQEGFVQDLRSTIPDLLGYRQRQPGAAVLLDMDHTDGTYAAAELLKRIFDRVIVVTPRDSLAQDTPLVTRQGILRHFHQLGIEYVLLSEPRWTAALEEEGRLEYANVYTEKRDFIADVAFFAYSTPRSPDVALAPSLTVAGLKVHFIGDCRVARDAMAATGDGFAVGSQV